VYLVDAHVDALDHAVVEGRLAVEQLLVIGARQLAVLEQRHRVDAGALQQLVPRASAQEPACVATHFNII
jgi:hypothetical protein